MTLLTPKKTFPTVLLRLNRRTYSADKLLSQILRRFPEDMRVLSGIEVDFFFIFSAYPDHRSPECHGKACLKIGAGILPSHIGYHKLTPTDLGNDSVTDFVVVFYLIKPD